MVAAMTSDKSYCGEILLVVEDLAIEEILCLRVKTENGEYPTVTLYGVVFNQIHQSESCRGISEIREISFKQLCSAQYYELMMSYHTQSGDWSGNMLKSFMKHRPLRFFVHQMSDLSARLVIAERAEVHFGAVKYENTPYWERGYTYRDVYQYFIASGIG